jgi:hypothetical protein
MNRILHWITERLSSPASTAETDQRDSGHVEPVVNEEDGPVGVFTVRHARTNTDNSTTNGCQEATGDTQPDLAIIESPSETPVISESYDPYDSGTYRILKK